MDMDKMPNERSAKIERIMQDNPELSYEFVRQLIIALEEVEADKVEPYELE